VRRKLLLGLALASPVFCDIFGISDAIYWTQQLTMMAQQLNQAQQIYSNAMQYKQMFENASAFVHNPAMFLGQVAAMEQMALSTGSSAGFGTSQRIEQLQRMINMQRTAMGEIQSIGTLSNGNMTGISQLASTMSRTSQELAIAQSQLVTEQREDVYRSHNQYQPQAAAISNWRMK
jgi:hypothetical protein